MYNDIITLIKEEFSTNDTGDLISNERTRTVYAQVKSIGMSEFYQAQAQGFKPEIKFVISDYLDYQNEQFLIYGEYKYKVLRVYRNGMQLEIVCFGGINYGRTKIGD